MAGQAPGLIARPGRPDDAQALARLHAEAWVAAYRDLLPAEVLAGFTLERRLPLWRSLLKHPEKALVLVAETDAGAARGMLWLRRISAEGAGFASEIVVIAVDPARQRRGVGRQLMAALGERLMALAVPDTYLWVYRDNAAARAFYEAVGGRLIDEDVERYGELTLPIVAYAWNPLSDLRRATAPGAGA